MNSFAPWAAIKFHDSRMPYDRLLSMHTVPIITAAEVVDCHVAGAHDDIFGQILLGPLILKTTFVKGNFRAGGPRALLAERSEPGWRASIQILRNDRSLRLLEIELPVILHIDLKRIGLPMRVP